MISKQIIIRLFADETSLYIIAENPTISAEILNNDRNPIISWPKRCVVTFNPLKIESMVLNFSHKLTKAQHPDLQMDNTVIANVETH